MVPRVAMYPHIYLKWDGSLTVSSLTTFTISFSDFLFKDAIEILVKFMLNCKLTKH